MPISKFILSASAMLAAAAAIYGAYAHDWQLVAVGVISFGVTSIPLAYGKLVVKVALKNGTQVTVDASRAEG